MAVPLPTNPKISQLPLAQREYQEVELKTLSSQIRPELQLMERLQSALKRGLKQAF